MESLTAVPAAPPPAHIVLVPTHLWGHARPMAVLAARMVRLRPVIVTLCLGNKIASRARGEIMHDIRAGPLGSGGEEALARLRVLEVEQGADHLDPAVFRDSFLEAWGRLCAGETVRVEAMDGTPCEVDFKTSPPSAVVVDVFGSEITAALHALREQAPEPKGLRIYSWTPVSSSYTAVRYSMNPLAMIEAVAAREGMSLEEAAVSVVSTPRGTAVDCPCIPPVYDYELEPQGFIWPRELMLRVWVKGARALRHVEGTISFDAREYHSEAAAIMRDLMGRTGKKVYFAGPLLTARSNEKCGRGAVAGTELGRWMDGQVEKRGARSVVYVSFGSLFWPSEPVKVFAALEELMDLGVPFIMPRSSPLVKLPAELERRMEESADVWLDDWLPQQDILEHPAVGWSLTHAGHNTVLECIQAGVPMILWPITVDQGPNALHLSTNLRIAFELLEVRSGTGAGPVRRLGDKRLSGTVESVRKEVREVLGRAFGEEGERMRARVGEVSGVLEAAWASGESAGDKEGVARREVKAFIDDVSAYPPARLVQAKST
ncbi:glycosyltransferase family 1 protein [Trametes coccinea BRFM310]|uniref:Glycosyltransferase family 1 protein n=1 Tax=Trametes coccinea (strain BRFM310) TaxID=1353009 RepID=A0A1Y2IAI8_TRAC3|nr:glycosyltransferase family 1 protein [Trametes coccinea BRFM310]